MRKSFNESGHLVVTATSKSESRWLLDTVYQFEDGKPKEAPVQQEQTQTHKRKKMYAKQCPVVGCGVKAKHLGLHMRMTHGVDQDGNITGTFKHSKHGVMKVSKPVEIIDGVYHVKDGHTAESNTAHSRMTNFLGSSQKRQEVIV